MDESLTIKQTLKDGTIDTLTVNKDGVWFVRKDKSNVEITQKYSHKEFLTKVNDDKDKNSSDSKIVFSLLYLLYYGAHKKIKFIGIVERYINRNEEKFVNKLSVASKPLRILVATFVSVFVILSITSIFTFYIPLFNSIFNFQHLLWYFFGFIVLVYIVMLILIKPNNDLLSKKRIIRSIILGLLLFGQIATVYRFCSSQVYTVKGIVIDKTRLGRESKHSRVDEYSISVELENQKRCVLYTRTDLSANLNIKLGDSVSCTFKPIIPGIDLLVKYNFN